MALDLATVAVRPAPPPRDSRRGELADTAGLAAWGMLWRAAGFVAIAAVLVGAVPELPLARSRIVILALAAAMGVLLHPWGRSTWWAAVWRVTAAAAAVWVLGALVPAVAPPAIAGALALCVVEPVALRVRGLTRAAAVRPAMPSDGAAPPRRPIGRPAEGYDAFATPAAARSTVPPPPSAPQGVMRAASPVPVARVIPAAAEADDYDAWVLPSVPPDDADRLRRRILDQAAGQGMDPAAALRGLGFRPPAGRRKGTLLLSSGLTVQAPEGSYERPSGAVITPRGDRRRLDPVEAGRRQRVEEERLVVSMRRARIIGGWTARRMLRDIGRGGNAGHVPVRTGWL